MFRTRNTKEISPFGRDDNIPSVLAINGLMQLRHRTGAQPAERTFFLALRLSASMFFFGIIYRG